MKEIEKKKWTQSRALKNTVVNSEKVILMTFKNNTLTMIFEISFTQRKAAVNTVRTVFQV